MSEVFEAVRQILLRRSLTSLFTSGALTDCVLTGQKSEAGESGDGQSRH